MSRFVDTGASSSGLGDYSRGSKQFLGNNNSTYTFTVPQGTDEIFVCLYGAGGRGMVAASDYAGTGGGGGGFAGGSIKTTPGTTFIIGNGKGTSPSSGNTLEDGTDSTFKASDGTLLLTAGGGKSGTYNLTTSTQFSLGGLGGVGTVNNADYFIKSYAANGGRGGNITLTNGTGATAYLSTGGGASGSLSGDGGRGGDLAREDGASAARYGTGGGGWAGGNGGDILGSQDNSSAVFIGSGGGGYLNSGGGVFSTHSGYDFNCSGGNAFNTGQAWDQSTSDGFLRQAWTVAAGQNSTITPQNNYGGNVKRSWWSYMTGEALTGQNSFNTWQVNGDGCGGWGIGKDDSFFDQKAHMRGGFGGGMGGFAYNTGLQSLDTNLFNGGIRYGGGGGSNFYLSSNSRNAFNDAFNAGGETKAVMCAFGRAPLGGGGGASRLSYNLGGGDGWCVICYK